MLVKIFGSMFLGAFLMVGGTSFVYAENYKIDLKRDTNLRDILLGNIGKDVKLKTNVGEIEGTLKKVNDNLAHISRISRMEFYDAVVRLDQINMVIVRAREKMDEN